MVKAKINISANPAAIKAARDIAEGEKIIYLGDDVEFLLADLKGVILYPLIARQIPVAIGDFRHPNAEIFRSGTKYYLRATRAIEVDKNIKIKSSYETWWLRNG